MALTPEELEALKRASAKKKQSKPKVEEPEAIVPEITIGKVTKTKPLFNHVVEQHRNRNIEKELEAKKPKEKTADLLEMAHQEAIVHTIQNDEGIQKKVIKGAEEHVLSELEVRTQEQKKKVQDATFDAIEDAAQNYGIDSGRPLWQLRLAQIGSSFWFVIWFTISSFTFTPVLFFLKMIGTQIKNARLKWAFTLILYLLLVFGLFMWISKLAGWTWWNPSVAEPTVN